MLYFRSDGGSLVLTGTLAMQQFLSKDVSGSLATTGTLQKNVSKPSLGGSLSLFGTIQKSVSKPNLSGSLSLSGGVSIVIHKYPRTRSVAGILNLGPGTLQKCVGKQVGGTISLTGGLARQVFRSRNLSGDLHLYGDLLAGKSNKQQVQGTLSPTGTLELDYGKAPGGTLGLSGGVTLVIHRQVAVGGELALSGSIALYVPSMSLSGELGLSGDLQKKVSKNLSGDIGITGTVGNTKAKSIDGILSIGREASLELSGTLEIVRHFSRSLEGTLELTGGVETPARLTGDLALTGDLTINKRINQAVGGTLSLTGVAGFPKHYYIDVDGSLTFMKVLTVGVTPYIPANVSVLNQSAARDIVIEQGVSFRRFYRWMKSDGIPFDLSLFTLTMTITTSKDGGEAIAYGATDIVITKTGLEAGLFRVDIPASVTQEMDFTRAVYQIVASWSTGSVRLIEGTVVLSRGLFKHIQQSVSGSISLSGGNQVNVSKALSGEVSLTGTLVTS